MVATAAAVIGLSTDFAHSLGYQAAEHGAAALERQATEALGQNTAAQARRYGAEFQRTESILQLLSNQVENVLAHPDRHAPSAHRGLPAAPTAKC